MSNNHVNHPFSNPGVVLHLFRYHNRSRPTPPDSSPSGLRHLFSLSNPITLNREYIPHVAAVGRLVLGEGYNDENGGISLHVGVKKSEMEIRVHLRASASHSSLCALRAFT
jgi:hypothetical protein